MTERDADLIVHVVAFIVTFLPTIVAIPLMVLLVRDLYRTFGTTALYLRGRWREARELAARPFWQKRVFPSVRDAMIHTQAACLQMEGRLEESLRLLRTVPLDECDRKVRYVIASCLAEDLVLLGRDPEHAVEALAIAREFRVTPGDELLLAHAELSRRRADVAERCFEKAAVAKDLGLVVGLRTAVVSFRELDDVERAFLRGWYLARTGRRDEAKPLLEQVVGSRLDTFFKSCARDLLERGDPAPDGFGHLARAAE